jgi:hypothetical protein
MVMKSNFEHAFLIACFQSWCRMTSGRMPLIAEQCGKPDTCRTLPEVHHVDPTVYGLDFGQLLIFLTLHVNEVKLRAQVNP